MGETLTLVPAPPPSVLVAASDPALREVLADLLAEEGYTPSAASSLAEAQALIEERVFGLILAEVFAGASLSAWDDARTLLRRAQPAPVGLLVTHSSVPDSVARGFAFVQRMPFEMDELLARVAAATARPLTPEQQRWAHVVERYCAALAAADWDALLDLCSDDVVCYPPRDSVIVTVRKLEGKTAVRAYYEAAASHYRHIASTGMAIFPRSQGLTARHTLTWLGPDERPHKAATTLRLRFSGDRIRQLSMRANLPYVSPRPHTRPA